MTILKEYVGVHDDFFQVSARRIMPWPVEELIDFETHYNKLNGLKENLEHIKIEIRNINKDSVSVSEWNYLNALVKVYIPPLVGCIGKLQDICFKLDKKDVPVFFLEHFFLGYNIFAYRRDIKEYEKYVKQYLSFGERMNYLYNQIE